MYKRRYAHSRLKKALDAFDIDEERKEKENVQKLTKTIQKIIHPETPIEKVIKKQKKDSKSKPINTRILLKGFVYD